MVIINSIQNIFFNSPKIKLNCQFKINNTYISNKKTEYTIELIKNDEIKFNQFNKFFKILNYGIYQIVKLNDSEFITCFNKKI